MLCCSTFVFLYMRYKSVCVCVCVCVCVREHMAPYTIPTGIIVVEEMPRNQMGKVNKKDLLRTVSPS